MGVKYFGNISTKQNTNWNRPNALADSAFCSCISCVSPAPSKICEVVGLHNAKYLLKIPKFPMNWLKLLMKCMPMWDYWYHVIDCYSIKYLINTMLNQMNNTFDILALVGLYVKCVYNSSHQLWFAYQG